MGRAKKRDWRTPPAPAPAPTDAAATEILGVVESLVFRNETTGYTVCRIKIAGAPQEQTVVGNCTAIWAGETLKATGHWTRHKQHGYQFQADSLVCVPPTSARGIERYLASGMLRGIGKVTARRLVEKFGDDTLHILEKESKRLEEVEGIGPARRALIKASWTEQRAVRDIMIFLQGHGIGSGQSARIYRRYGDQAIAVIRQNPYRLCADVWGIGFKTADAVAMSMGLAPDSEARARAGLLHVLDTLQDEGHCFCPQAELLLQAQALLDIPVEGLADALKREREAGTVVFEGDRVFLRGIYDAEVTVARRVRALLATPAAFRPIEADRAVAWAERKMGIAFAPLQAAALNLALRSKVAIITGGPGVGKTTIIRALVDVFLARRLLVHLAAPTGRAAKRMTEATGHEATTLHRLLKYAPNTGAFTHDAGNPIEGHVFILDEVSMVDVRLMRDFLVALPPAACLVLVGDIDQLPSVGPGNVLRDLIQSDVIPCQKLDVIFRQGAGSLIVRNAHHVNSGEWLETAEGTAAADFYFIEAEEPEQIIQRLLELVLRRIPQRFGFDPLRDIQVLTPMRRNELGADNLNIVLQEALNPGGAAVERYGRKFREGDRLMQIRNNYDKGVFNGDIGRLQKVDTVDQRIVVDFDGEAVTYDLTELDEVVHAYACSIHKSQGSEYPAVVILLSTQHFKLLQRNLLYTAITRGKKLVCLVGSRKAVGMAIRNNEIRLRRTGLRGRVAEAEPSEATTDAHERGP